MNNQKNYVEDKFNLLYKEIAELKRQLHHNDNTKDNATTEEMNPNDRETRKDTVRNSNEEVEKKVEQWMQSQDEKINRINQYIKEMDNNNRERTDQFEAKNLQEKEALTIINEQIIS